MNVDNIRKRIKPLLANVPILFRQFAQNYAETISFHKISTPGNQVKLRYFLQSQKPKAFQYFSWGIKWEQWPAHLVTLLRKSVIRNFIFCAVYGILVSQKSQKMSFMLSDENMLEDKANERSLLCVYAQQSKTVFFTLVKSPFEHILPLNQRKDSPIESWNYNTNRNNM